MSILYWPLCLVWDVIGHLVSPHLTAYIWGQKYLIGQSSQTLQVLFSICFHLFPSIMGKWGINMNHVLRISNSHHETSDWWSIPGGLSWIAAETVASVRNHLGVFVQLTAFLRHQTGIENLSLSISWLVSSHPRMSISSEVFMIRDSHSCHLQGYIS